MLTEKDKALLSNILGQEENHNCAVNIRKNGEGVERHVTENIDIIGKKDKPGIDVIIKPNTKGESVKIPVIVTDEGMNDKVYNTFEVGANSDVDIVAGCGIHNDGSHNTGHDGVHEFFVRENAHMRYSENHYGEGSGKGGKILNPETIIEVFKGGVVELEMAQIGGVTSTERDTVITLHEDAKLIITERLMTDEEQVAKSKIIVNLDGKNSSAQVISRSVAKGNSVQYFEMTLNGRNKCKGHLQCDTIVMDNAKVASVPKIDAISTEAELIHEAQIGRIANDQLMKLTTLGISEEEAEEIIIDGFLG